MMKKIYKIVLLTLIILAASFGMGTVHAYDNFEIETYFVFINVLENNVVEVEEIIYADFEYESHGIYREISIKGFFSRTVDDEFIETRYRAIISDVDVLNQKFTSKKEGNYQIIKIGDKNVWVDGMQKYHIKYTLDFGEDGVDDFDEFYFDVIGTGWNTYINKVAVTIMMPKEFDQNEIGISTGYAGESGSDMVRLEVSDEEITIFTTQILYPYEGMTVRIHLPEGYFEAERIPTDWNKVFIYAISSLVGVIMLTWLTFGRADKLYPSVEFYPPEDLPPAEVGYIVDGYLETRDVLSLLIYWADKGYIKIVEAKADDFYLIKLKSLSDNAQYYEQTLFIDLFKNRTEQDYSDFIEKTAENENLSQLHSFLLEKQRNNESLTYVRIKDLRNVFYSKIEKVKAEIRKKYSKKEGRRIFTSKSIWAKVLTFMVCPWPIYLGIILVKSQTNQYMDDAMVGGVFWCGLLLTMFIIIDQIVARRKSRKRKSNVTLTIVFGIVLAALAWVSTIIIGQTEDGPLISYVAVGGTFISALIAMFMQKRTPQVNKLHEKILGLRMFLVNAEQDRIERLVDDNPEYFFNILSYAYVLGVTDKWAKQFEKFAMKQPSWYESSSVNRHYFVPSTFTQSFTRNVNTMTTTMMSRPASSSTGGRSYSGSSFSGGGGSSGGGGGGGGGGSW